MLALHHAHQDLSCQRGAHRPQVLAVIAELLRLLEYLAPQRRFHRQAFAHQYFTVGALAQLAQRHRLQTHAARHLVAGRQPHHHAAPQVAQW